MFLTNIGRRRVLSPKRQPMTPADLAGKTVAIIGCGREGAAIAMALGATPDITLMAIIDSEGGPGAYWEERCPRSIPVHVFDGEADLPAGIDVAVVSPGVAPHRPLFQALAAAGVLFTSGTDLYVNSFADRIVAVTGSKGKSTTSALIAHLLAHHGVDVSWGGNVGVPLWDLPRREWTVAEVSSYQCSSLTVSPRVAVVTSLFEEHLDWHGSADQYFADKLNLLANEPTHVVVGGQSPILTEQLEHRYPTKPRTTVGKDGRWSVIEGVDGWQVSMDGEAVVAGDDLPLWGVHNGWNVALALEAASRVVDLDRDTVVSALTSFSPLPHRLEPIEDPSGVVFINDSLATNPPAAAMALGALAGKRVIVLLGGADRGVDRGVLLDQVVATPPIACIGLPESGPGLLEDIRETMTRAGVAVPELVPVSSMDEAIVWARRLAQPGDVVIMSPGAPSFGQYRDYEHRANEFRRAIVDTG